MTLQTYTIEMKVDAPDEGHEAIQTIIRQYARDMLSSAMLLSLERQPQVAVRMQDSFYSMQEIEVLEPSENVLKP